MRCDRARRSFQLRGAGVRGGDRGRVTDLPDGEEDHHPRLGPDFVSLTASGQGVPGFWRHRAKHLNKPNSEKTTHNNIYIYQYKNAY
jgi:hypothetical protein